MKPRPGDLLLDRYLKGADEETHERAREAPNRELRIAHRQPGCRKQPEDVHRQD